MAKITPKVKVNDLHFRESRDAYLVQTWWF